MGYSECMLLAPRLGFSSPGSGCGMWWHALPIRALGLFQGRQSHLDCDRLLRCWIFLREQVGPAYMEMLFINGGISYGICPTILPLRKLSGKPGHTEFEASTRYWWRKLP